MIAHSIRLGILTLYCVAAATPVGAGAQPVGNDTRPARDTGGGDRANEDPWPDALVALDQRAGRIEDLSAEFTERKYTSLLKKPLVSRGRVWIKGVRSRWVTLEPHQSTMAMDGRQIQIYYPQRSTVEVYDIDARVQSLAVSPLPRLDVLQQHFEIKSLDPAHLAAASGEGHTAWDGDGTAPWLALRLTPKSDTLLAYVERVDVVIDRETACVLRAEMTDPDGDRTLISFSDFKVNSGLALEDVTLVVPPGTKVVRPLDASSDRGREAGGGAAP